jgi:hypothetical protein
MNKAIYIDSETKISIIFDDIILIIGYIKL